MKALMFNVALIFIYNECRDCAFFVVYADLLVTGIVENIGHSALNRLGELLLNLLRDDGIVATIKSVCLVGALVVGVGAGRMDLIDSVSY